MLRVCAGSPAFLERLDSIVGRWMHMTVRPSTSKPAAMAIKGTRTVSAISFLVRILLELVRINAPTTSGPEAWPTELKACARVSRAGALSSGPRMVTYGLAAVCKAVTPEAITKIAVKKSGKLTILARSEEH